jgi:hypothetical protein
MRRAESSRPGGHATIGETYDTYGQWFRDDEEQGRGVIEAMFSEQAEGREAR